MNTQPKPIFVQPEAGKNLHFPGGDIASIMLSGDQTGGMLAVVACTQAPDSGPPLHIHRNEDELFLTVEGLYSFFAEGRWVEVGAGGAVYLPKGDSSLLSKHWNNDWPSLGHHSSIGLGAVHDPICQGVGKPGWPRSIVCLKLLANTVSSTSRRVRIDAYSENASTNTSLPLGQPCT
jgi:quercetin dioxygenase-like cupin family protein